MRFRDYDFFKLLLNVSSILFDYLERNLFSVAIRVGNYATLVFLSIKNDLQNGAKHLQNGPKLLAVDEITVSSVRGWGDIQVPFFWKQGVFFQSRRFQVSFQRDGGLHR